MKRSRSLSLLLMGSLAFGAAGCGSDEPKVEESLSTFTSLAECVDSNIFTQAECVDLARSAVQASPRFSSKEECEATFGVGECQQPTAVASAGTSNSTEVAPRTTSSWMPLMMGFMAGRMLSGGGMMQGSQPLYKDPAAKAGDTRSFRTSTGESVSADNKGRVTKAPANIKQSLGHNAKPVMSRGGKASSGGFSGGKSFGSTGS